MISYVLMLIDWTISSCLGFLAGLVNFRLFIGDLDYEKVEKPFMQACVRMISLRPTDPAAPKFTLLILFISIFVVGELTLPLGISVYRP